MIFLFLRSGRDRFSRQTLWKSSISEWPELPAGGQNYPPDGYGAPPPTRQGLNHVTPNRAFREKSRAEHCRSLCKVASMATYGLILSPRSMQSVATAVLSEDAMAAMESMRSYRKLIYLHS